MATMPAAHSVPVHGERHAIPFILFFEFTTMCEQDSMSRSWSELPMSALTLSFEKLPRRQRAGSVDCVARVCSSWAEAAAAATWSIQLLSTDTDSLQRWLTNRGASVLKISLIESSGVVTTLACPKLQHLVLKNCSVDLRPGSQLLRDLCSATALTSLCFHDVTYQGEPDLAAALLALPNLQKLWLLMEKYIQVQGSPQPPPQQQQLHASPANEVQHSGPTSQLWSAHGDPTDGYRCFTDSGWQFICKLTKLVGLELSSLQGITAAGLAGLHKLQELRRLNLEDLTSKVSLSAVPAFSQLTALTALVLYWVWKPPHCEFDPSILAHMTQLEDVALLCCTLARGTAGAAELLYRLSRLPELRKLDLKYVAGLEQCPPQAFSALKSSSVLESLTWRAWRPFRDQPGPWQHMFLESLKLPMLAQLDTAYSMPWGASDLDRLVSSCSALKELSLRCSPGLQLTALLQLLTALRLLWAAGVTEDSTVASLVQLSALQGLHELIVMDPCSFTDDAVRSLTALTQLKHLGLSGRDGVFSTNMQQQLMQQFSQYELAVHNSTYQAITNTAPAGAPPDVWSQLLSCCEACAQATQQQEAALDAAVEQQQQQEVDEEAAPAAPQQQQQQQHMPPGVAG